VLNVRLAQLLPNAEYSLELVPIEPGPAQIDFLQVFEPPLKGK